MTHKKVALVDLQIGCDPVEAVHGHFVAQEAAGVRGEGPEHHGYGAPVERPGSLFLHEMTEDVANSCVFALRGCKIKKDKKCHLSINLGKMKFSSNQAKNLSFSN